MRRNWRKNGERIRLHEKLLLGRSAGTKSSSFCEEIDYIEIRHGFLEGDSVGLKSI